MSRVLFLKKNIENLYLYNTVINKLKGHNIFIVEDLWRMNRKELKQIGFTNSEISQIIIKLQLNGLDLNKKIY